MSKRYTYVIIGSGPTGLGAAYRLKESGIEDFIVLEKEAYVGGLSATFTDENGFLWDIGGHVQFSHYRYFDDLMQKALGEDGWLSHQRESWIWIRDCFVPYPFQNNIRYLPREIMWKCLEGIIRNHTNPVVSKPENFQDWIGIVFGSGIAEEFMIPYNFKVWGYPAEEMSYLWTGERVATADLSRVTKNILFDEDDFSWGPNNMFRFPKRGGTGSVWSAVAGMIGAERFSLDSEVRGVDPERKEVVLGDGRRIEYGVLLNTTPLDTFVGKVESFPEVSVRSATRLKHSSTNVVGIGLKGAPNDRLKGKCWMYFPQANSPYYRVTVFSHYSPFNVPGEGYWSLMTETTDSERKPVDQADLVGWTIRALIEDGLVDSEDDIVSTFVYRAEYGYPTPSLDRDAILEDVLPKLEKMNIFTRGRFGAWKYEVGNQDHSFMQGVEWVDKMVLDVPERTMPFPNVVNAGGKN